MGGDHNMGREKLTFLEQLRPFAGNEEVFGRFRADLQDLLEASEWLLGTVRSLESRELSVSELEDLLVEIDVNFVEHASFHISSFRGDLKSMLENFPDDNDEAMSRS
jgi:hypothetical protein